MSLVSPAEMASTKPDIKSTTRRRSLLNIFSTTSVPLRRSSVQGAAASAHGKFGGAGLEGDLQDVSVVVEDVEAGKRGGVAGSIPEDVICEIAAVLSIADILSFSLTVSSLPFMNHISNSFSCLQSTCLRRILLPFLYDTVVLKSSKKCRIALDMLGSQRDICKFVKKLAVRPNYYLSWPRPDEYLQEDWVVTKLEELAWDLENMHTFDWDGLELPDDRLWETLRLR
jgi:hypothetical protein